MTTHPTWHKSSYSGSGGCLETVASTDRVLIRDSNDPSQVLLVTRADWDAFVAGVRDGEFDPEPGLQDAADYVWPGDEDNQ